MELEVELCFPLIESMMDEEEEDEEKMKKIIEKKMQETTISRITLGRNSHFDSGWSTVAAGFRRFLNPRSK